MTYRILILLVTLACPAAAVEESFGEKYRALANESGLSDSARLGRLLEIDWERTMLDYPEFATAVGYPGQDGRWTDISLEAIGQRKAQTEWPVQVLRVINRAKLSEQDQLTYDLFEFEVKRGLEGNTYPGEFLAINQLGGVQQSAQTLEQMTHATAAQYDAILSRLRGIPRVVDQTIVLLRAGVKQGVTPARITLRELPRQILEAAPENPDRSALLEHFREAPANLPEREQRISEARKVYLEEIAPAFQRLHAFIEKEYIPHCRESVSWSALPNGMAWYEFNIRNHTTTGMSAREIHEIGLAEVKRIRGEMEKTVRDSGFKGTFDEFVAFLQNDPQFHFGSADQLLAGYRDIAKRIDPELPRLFRKLPRLTYGIKSIPEYAAKSAPAAYYQGGSNEVGRPGWFLANTFDLKARPKWQMEALTLHEAVPGHHLQISLAQELEGLPEFRRHGGYTAFVEGWGLYAETLGSDLGLYRDPYSRFGALTYEMWRAARLVVDTGIHSLGWDRQQAIDFMLANTGKTEHEATVEIDRYITWPGQALAYKIGQLKIQALLDEAKAELGAGFDRRAFHEALLAKGALPLELLEKSIKQWIATVKPAAK
jgi:uncharacterized protein (DUF885 family)